MGVAFPIRGTSDRIPIEKSKLSRVLVFQEAKSSVESGKVLKSGFIRDFRDRFVCFDEERTGPADAFFCQPLAESASGNAFESS